MKTMYKGDFAITVGKLDKNVKVKGDGDYGYTIRFIENFDAMVDLITKEDGKGFNTPDEAYNAAVKRLDKICNRCLNANLTQAFTNAEDEETTHACTSCGGVGVIRLQQGFFTPPPVTCPRCNGTGRQ